MGTLGTLLGLMVDGIRRERMLKAYLELADLDTALAYAALFLEEREEVLSFPPVRWRSARR